MSNPDFDKWFDDCGKENTSQSLKREEPSLVYNTTKMGEVYVQLGQATRRQLNGLADGCIATDSTIIELATALGLNEEDCFILGRYNNYKGFVASEYIRPLLAQLAEIDANSR